MRIVVLNDLNLRIAHAFSAVYVTGKPYILDTRSRKVVPGEFRSTTISRSIRSMRMAGGCITPAEAAATKSHIVSLWQFRDPGRATDHHAHRQQRIPKSIGLGETTHVMSHGAEPRGEPHRRVSAASELEYSTALSRSLIPTLVAASLIALLCATATRTAGISQLGLFRTRELHFRQPETIPKWRDMLARFETRDGGLHARPLPLDDGKQLVASLHGRNAGWRS